MTSKNPVDNVNMDTPEILTKGSSSADDTFDKDVFDGIEDIYEDLEGSPPPPPPFSKTDMSKARNLTPHPSFELVLDAANDENTEQQGYSYFCGMNPPKKSTKTTKSWSIFKFRTNSEVEEDNTKMSEFEAAPRVGVVENGGKENDDEFEGKVTWAQENDDTSTVHARDTIIQHSIGKDVQEIRSEKIQKYYPLSFWEESLSAGINANNDMNSTSEITTSTNSTQEPFDQVTLELISLCNKEGFTLEDRIILTPNQVMSSGEYFCSPSKTYMVGMMSDLAIIDIYSNEVVWAAGVTDGARTIMQADGNVVVENEDGEVLWNTGPVPSSDGMFDIQMVFGETNEGVIAVQQVPTRGETLSPSNFWMEGAFESKYCDDCPRENLEFPVRGTFYYPTYDGTEMAWRNERGNLPEHSPLLGWYSSSDPEVGRAHVDGMEYANIDLAISSWEGPGTNFDRSRISMLLEETSKQNAALKWTVYHEAEQRNRPSPEEIQSDLEYLKKWFVWQDAWAHIDGKPVIYVNNDDGCNVAERWVTAAAPDWYVVLKLFDGFKDCEFQPDSWHEKRVNVLSDGVDIVEGLYYNLAPGEWSSGRRRPSVERQSRREWCNRVRGMVNSNEQWQLIVSFNEASQGTSIEPSMDWRSDSPYGEFLDCLHDPQMF
eukprot:jgi/Psemu1/16631/gm1.16631_g